MFKIDIHIIPITNRNELPRIKLLISSSSGDNEISISMLYDIGAVLNTGHLLYHEYIFSYGS